MLKCKDVAHEASDYIDHNLGWWRRMWFRLHLIVCFNCRRFISHIRATREFIQRREHPPLQLPDAETKQIVKQVEEAEQR